VKSPVCFCLSSKKLLFLFDKAATRTNPSSVYLMTEMRRINKVVFSSVAAIVTKIKRVLRVDYVHHYAGFPSHSCIDRFPHTHPLLLSYFTILHYMNTVHWWLKVTAAIEESMRGKM
jgi:hypothetical protein